jgi:hypothetical protein
MRALRQLGFLAFWAWEAFWAYAYLTASTPDLAMARPAALLFGLVMPALVGGLVVALMVVFRAVLRFPPR